MLEVCVESVQSARAAYASGAGRIELCSGLELGGVTPSQALIEAVCEEVSCPVVVLIRPRPGDFIYDHDDLKLIRRSIETVVRNTIAGVVVGGLDRFRQLDGALLQSAREICPPALQLVMHRAFDFVRDPFVALDQLVEQKFDRVLTSGGPMGNANSNLATLRRLVAHANSRITVLPGGGITAENAEALLSQTGCTELHGSFRLHRPLDGSVGFESNGFGSYSQVDQPAIASVSRLCALTKRQQ